MELESLKIFSKQDQVAWVGSGGKSSLIFSILKDLYVKSILTTTTHLAVEQSLFANHHLILKSTQSLESQISKINEGITLISTGIDQTEPKKLSGFKLDEIQHLSKFCLDHSVPLFIEADGSRNKPLKSPADYEPQIPHFVSKVCLVAGLSGLGKPLGDQYVHRSHIFAKIVKKDIGETITTDDLFRYLTSPFGGLKSIPEGVEKILFLNQADCIEDQNEILNLALNCKRYYDHILITTTNPNTFNISVIAHFGQVACTILAAGEAKRFDFPKQLAKWNDKSFVKTIVEKMQAVPVDKIYVVTGAYSNLIEAELKGLNCITIFNSEWKSGQSSSVKTAIKNLPENMDAIVFLLVDQPQFDIEMVNNLLKKHALTNADIIIHEFKGMHRHPVLFSRKLFPFLVELKGDAGGRQLFEQFPPVTIKINDPYLAIDIDTKEDLKKLSSYRASKSN